MSVIFVPQELPDLSLGLNVAVDFKMTQKLALFCSDPNAFNPPIPNGRIFLTGEEFPTKTAKVETVQISWTLGVSPGISPQSIMGFRTIHITSGTALYKKVLLAALNEDPAFRRLFIRCVPNTVRLLNALMERKLLPLPRHSLKLLKMFLKVAESIK
jgi:hypothetical protein